MGGKREEGREGNGERGMGRKREEGREGNGEWVMGNGEVGRGKREDVNYTFPLFHNSIIPEFHNPTRPSQGSTGGEWQSAPEVGIG